MSNLSESATGFQIGNNTPRLRSENWTDQSLDGKSEANLGDNAGCTC